MKKQALLSLCLGSLLAFGAPLVFAEKGDSNTMQISKVLETLADKGFSIVSDIELKDGKYVAKVINAEGRTGKVTFNPTTNEIAKPSQNQPGMTALDIAKKLEGEGYHNISKIDTEWLHDKYNVKGIDKNGRKVEIAVDALTGNINKK